MIQEHNIKDVTKIEYLAEFYHIILNKSILLKGGTLIAIDKRLPATIGHTYIHPTSRLSTAYLNVFNTMLYLINLYIHQERIKKGRERGVL